MTKERNGFEEVARCRRTCPLCALAIVATTAAQSTSGSHNVVSGTVSKIDHTAKTVAVKTRDGR